MASISKRKDSIQLLNKPSVVLTVKNPMILHPRRGQYSKMASWRHWEARRRHGSSRKWVRSEPHPAVPRSLTAVEVMAVFH